MTKEELVKIAQQLIASGTLITMEQYENLLYGATWNDRRRSIPRKEISF
jgi:hypothetical protein